MNEAIRVLELKGPNPKEWGRNHGEAFRKEIREIAEIRMERMCHVSAFKTEKAVGSLAEKYLGLLARADRDLFDELYGIFESSQVPLARLMVLNNYTDMRDVALSEDGGCSIIFSPGINGPILGQTWDIHGTALPFVVVLKFEHCIIFSITGCLGMTGINSFGVALAINNLASIDARPGLMWPAAVRKALRGSSAVQAKDEIMNMQTGSGRHYAIADKNNFYGIETSGTKKKIIHNRSDEVYFHTNHCLDKEMFKTHKIAKDSTTMERFRFLDEEARHQDLKSPSKVFLALAGVGMLVNNDHPQNTATCGTIVMDIANHSMLACPGIASDEQLLNPNTTIHF